MKKIILLTTFRLETDLVRTKELNQCLKINCKSSIDRIIVFFEGKKKDLSIYPSLLLPKVEIIYIHERPMYDLFFNYANQYLKGYFIIVSNADIYFDKNSNIERVKEIKLNHLWALCRYDFDKQKKQWYLLQKGIEGSHDSYLFFSPIKKIKGNILASIFGCDTLFVQRAIQAKLPVSNPCLSIKIKHLHNSKIRRWFLDNKKISYRNNPEFMEGKHDAPYYSTYILPPSTIEDNHYYGKKLTNLFPKSLSKKTVLLYLDIIFGFKYKESLTKSEKLDYKKKVLKDLKSRFPDLFFDLDQNPIVRLKSLEKIKTFTNLCITESPLDKIEILRSHYKHYRHAGLTGKWFFIKNFGLKNYFKVKEWQK